MLKSMLTTRHAKRVGRFAYNKVAPVFENSARSKWLPLDSRVIGPPRHWAHTPDYCRAHGFEWREVITAGEIIRRAPRCTNYPAADMLKLVYTNVAAEGTARLANARVVGPHGWVIGEGDTYLPDHSWFRNAIDECAIYRKEELDTSTHLSGVTLSLCTEWSTNYGHVAFDALSRIHLFEQAGYTWDDVSHILMPGLSSEGKQRMAQLCGIPLDKAVMLNGCSVVECEELIVPTFPGVRRNTPPWVADFWQKKAPDIPQRGRRLFISRRGSTRNILNEDALAPVLAEFGFETIVSSSRPIGDRYSEAEMVIGPHGAALTDILFCHPGSALIELTPPGHIFPYFYTIADSVGMEYFSTLGEYPGGQPENTKIADFTVSPEELRKTICAAEEALDGNRSSLGESLELSAA